MKDLRDGIVNMKTFNPIKQVKKSKSDAKLSKIDRVSYEGLRVSLF